MVSVDFQAGPLLGLSNNLADAVEQAGTSIVAVHARPQLASSGVHWRTGVIVTADHTIDRQDNITVTLPDGRSIPATLAGRDPGTDLAILRIEAGDLPAASIDESTPRVGHIVLAVARPGNSGLGASLGAVSAVGGSWRTWGGGQIDHFVRPDLTLYPGFSGGALVTAAGQVVGINTSGLTRNMSLAIPAITVNRVVDQLLTKGRVARGYIGAGMQRVQLPESLQQSLSLPQRAGLIVVSVESAGPADRAGILVGDILVGLDGTPVTNTDDVQGLLGPERVEQTVQADLVRGGTRTSIAITVGERPRREQ